MSVDTYQQTSLLNSAILEGDVQKVENIAAILNDAEDNFWLKTAIITILTNKRGPKQLTLLETVIPYWSAQLSATDQHDILNTMDQSNAWPAAPIFHHMNCKIPDNFNDKVMIALGQGQWSYPDLFIDPAQGIRLDTINNFCWHLFNHPISDTPDDPRIAWSRVNGLVRPDYLEKLISFKGWPISTLKQMMKRQFLFTAKNQDDKTWDTLTNQSTWLTSVNMLIEAEWIQEEPVLKLLSDTENTHLEDKIKKTFADAAFYKLDQTTPKVSIVSHKALRL